MLRTIEATVDAHGRVKLAEDIVLDHPTRALVTILDDAWSVREAALLSESALADGWSGTDADDAWKHLDDLPDLDENAK